MKFFSRQVRVSSSALVRARGASLVEYTLLLVGVLLLAAGAVKSLGPKIQSSMDATGGHF
ncbi:MAG: hypothetical protein U0183_20080 [Polyangiaceae bacterium]